MHKKHIRTQIVKKKEALQQALEIRHRVFVVGQGVPPDLEEDGEDPRCTHFLVYAGEDAVGTGRLRPYRDGVVKIERMAILAPWRNQGIGRRLLDRMIEYAADAGYHIAVLHAQTPAISFYVRAGFQQEGDIFYEADLPHVQMNRPL